MTVPTQLSLYNQALRMVGEPKLGTLTDDRPERYLLDTIWDEDPIKQMLEEAQWTFAIRSLEWNYDPSVTLDYGYRYAFTKPSNYVRTAAFCLDEFYKCPIREFADEGGYWFCDYETVYIKYVSDDEQFGRDYSLWPELFRNCVASKMACELAISLTKSQSLQEKAEKMLSEYVKNAKSLDAMNQPSKRIPPGSWVRSRTLSYSSTY